MTRSPAQGFINFYERSLVSQSFRFSDYFKEQFDFQSPIKYEVQFHSSIEKQLISLSNAIFKNLQLNKFFEKNADAELKYSEFIQLYSSLYSLIKGVVSNQEFDENYIIKLILLLHMSKVSFHQETFNMFFIRLDSVEFADADILSRHEYTGELKDLYLKIIRNNKIRQISIDVIRNINGFAKTHIYDVHNIKLVFIIDQLDGLFGFAGINSIYVSLNTYSKLNAKLDKDSKMIILKMDFIRLIQHELTHLLLRESANNVNISTPDLLKNSNRDHLIQESGIMAESKHFSRRIDWVLSSFSKTLNFEYCQDYIKRIEANEEVDFDINRANIIENTSDICCMALDMCIKKKVSYH